MSRGDPNTLFQLFTAYDVVFVRSKYAALRLAVGVKVPRVMKYLLYPTMLL